MACPLDTWQVLAAANWTYVTHEASTFSGERKRKPGYRALVNGSRLELSTRARGRQEFKLGYLGTSRSRAIARLTCVDGCSCAPLELRASNGKLPADTTATTEFTPAHYADASALVDAHHSHGARAEGCAVRVELITDGEPFKVVALHVHSL